MKNTIVFIFSFALALMFQHSVFATNPVVKSDKFIVTEIKYKLTLEKIFSEGDRTKVEHSLFEMGAPFTIESIDYASQVMIIKMKKKVPFDEVKQAIDKLGLRIAKEELIEVN